MEIGSSSTGTNPNTPAALGGTKKLPFHLQVSEFYGVSNIYRTATYVCTCAYT